MGKVEIQDDITIVLQAQKTITHETVRISVTVQAQVDPGQNEADFRKEVHKSLNSFVPGEWRIQNINRQKGNQFETVSVQATVRVPDKENHQLETRASKVSRIGFEFYSPRAEYELTFDEIQKINAELRLSLFKQALEECAAFNETQKGALQGNPRYRISSSRFDHGNHNTTANNATPIMATAYAASPSPMGGGGKVALPQQQYQMEQDETNVAEQMGVSTRFSMVGSFTLRALYHG